MGVVLGVDLGSSSVRVVAVDESGDVVGGAASDYAGSLDWPHGRAEARVWLAATVDAIGDLVRRHPESSRPAAISFGGQSPSAVPAEIPQGLPVWPGVTVRHPAGADLDFSEACAAQAGVLEAELSGADVRPSQVYDWIAQQFGAEYHQSRWVADPAVPGWGDRCETGQQVGRTNGALALPAGIPIVAGGEDAFLAFWAGGLTRPGIAMDPGGRTGGFVVGVEAGSGGGLYEVASAATSTSIVGGPVNAHGLIIEWLRDFTGRPIEDLLDAAAAVPPGSNGVLFLPYLEGERAPRWNRTLRAEIAGIGSDTDYAHVSRAALEGTAYGLRQILDEVAGTGVVATHVISAGSPSRSPLWCEIKSSVLGLPMHIPAEPNLAAVGAALSAGAGVGWWPRPGSSGNGSLWPTPRMTVIDPVTDPRYEDGYRRFVELGDAISARTSPALAG